MDTPNTKSLRHIEVKDADKGEVTAVFATLNAVDSDGDVTVPGAFEKDAPVRISAYGHKSWEGALPVGRGTITEVKDEAIFTGRFFLDTVAGRDTFTVVKELGEAGLQEFSYGYDPVEFSFGEFEGREVRFLRKLKVHEVSPVLLGAGVGTRLLTAKSGLKFSQHIEAVLADLETLASRAAEVVALRAEKGKGVSDETAALLRRVAVAAKGLEDVLPAPTTSDDPALELSRSLALIQGVSR